MRITVLFKRKSNITALSEHEIMLGEQRVKIEKLTIAKWRELFTTVDKLPGLIVQVLSAPQEDFYPYVIAALDMAFDEIAQIVAVLTGLDADYITNNVGVDELIEYITKTITLNRLDAVAKNVKSLLPKPTQE
ncbi:hypothetical protein [Neobacillus sp. 19]|uniref:hypothetical protein n=1 Tax=Neobacillus sp. 19 TaxID=3394458 RepID=UPI003BF62F04